MQFVTSILFAAAIFIGLSAQSARAQSCQALLNDLVAHASTHKNGYNNYVEFKMVGNREASDWAQYAEGWLSYSPGGSVGIYHFPPHFNGEAEQFFSNRAWYDPVSPGTFLGEAHPFDPHHTDTLRVSFDINPLSLNNGKLTYTLLSANNASETVQPECKDRYMYAFLNDQMLVFTFKKVSAELPK